MMTTMHLPPDTIAHHRMLLDVIGQVAEPANAVLARQSDRHDDAMRKSFSVNIARDDLCCPPDQETLL